MIGKTTKETDFMQNTLWKTLWIVCVVMGL